MNGDKETTERLRELIRAAAAQLELKPESISSPTPSAITARTRAGDLVRLDVSNYPSDGLSR